MILISMWFGPWPRWINIYLESCRANADVDWLLVTDQAPPASRPPNVRFLKMTFREVLQRIEIKTGLDLSAIDGPYKLCDLKPAFGHTFEDEIAGHSHYGFADIDVVFGRIRHFYTDEVLTRFDVISTHERIVSGHLAVFRNTRRMRLSYRRIAGWRKRASLPRHFSLDEGPYRRVFKSGNPVLNAVLGLFWKRLFVERYSTISSRIGWWNDQPWPEHWLWQDGRLTNTQDDREYLYFHFMSWHSNRHRRDNSPAPWPTLSDNLVQLQWQDANRSGFAISPAGITPLPALQLDREHSPQSADVKA